MNDFGLFEDLAVLNRTKSPERMWFAKGSGARGRFYPYMSLRDYTVADFLCNPEKETPVFVRFSMSSGGRGSADTQRDNRGFAVRFFSEEGNYDLMGTSLPVFYIMDPHKMPALISALRPSPKTNIREPKRFWKFYSENPEMIHYITWLYGGSGTIKSYRNMPGHSVIPYLWTGRDNAQYLVRTHWHPLGGEKTISANEAEFLAGFDPDVAGRDLCHALDEGINVEYEMEIQIASRELALQQGLDLLNPTLIWDEQMFPLIKAGKMVLDKGPEDYEDEVENIAFSLGNTVKGIDFSGDPLSKMGSFACRDGHVYRLGKDYRKLGVNQALGCVHEDISRASPVFGGNCFIENTFRQASERLEKMGIEGREKLAMAVAQEVLFIDEKIQWEITKHFDDIHNDFANMVARRVGI